MSESPAFGARVFVLFGLLERVWGRNYFGSDYVLDVHVTNLRKKLEDDPSNPHYVQTVRGVQVRPAMKWPQRLPRGLGAKLFA